MALTATIYNFDVQLSDTDRNVYETLAIRLARQPSETAEYLLTRALAYCLEFTEGIAFSRGLAEPDEPALAVRDLTGALRVWIDIGTPDPARIHKASKAADRVAIYTHKDPAILVQKLASERIHRADEVEIWAVDRGLIAARGAPRPSSLARSGRDRSAPVRDARRRDVLRRRDAGRVADELSRR